MNYMDMLGIGLDLMAILITFVILIGVLIGKRNAMNEYFPILLLMNACTVLADMGTLVFADSPELTTALEISIILQGSFAYVSISGFNLYIDKLITRKAGKRPLFRVIPFVISAIMILFWISSALHGFCWSITDEGQYVTGGLYWVMLVVGGAIALFDMFRVLFNQTKGILDGQISITLYLFLLVPFLALALGIYINHMSVFFASITISYLIMYIMIHVHTEQNVVEQKMDSTVMKTDLIMSQIQPHFMFNSLTNIKYLIHKDPDLAEQALDTFTKYLRENLDAISDQVLVPFSEELEHTKHYIWMEQVRFKDLKVEYSIDTDEFMIPRLSLQPVVESAVKHGVTKKIGGGTINIKVREFDNCYKIIVKDNGVGFENNEGAANESITMTDIRKRLYAMNKSKLSITSTKDIGTTVTYMIMKGEDTNS